MKQSTYYRLLMILTIVLLTIQTKAQTEKEVESKISDVTVFIEGAQITRKVTTSVSKGTTIIKLKGTTPYVDTKSIQVKGEGKFTIMAVNFQTNYLEKQKDDEKGKILKETIEKLEKKIEDEKTWIEVLKEREVFLVKNRNISYAEKMSVEYFSSMSNLYGNKIKEIKFSIIEKQRLIEAYNDQVIDNEKQLKQIQTKKELPQGEILIEVSTKATTTAKLAVSYLVGNAGWHPSYDIRVDNITEPVSLIYKANVFQKTGVDWNNVKLKFSNATPNQSGTVPELSPYYLKYGSNRKKYGSTNRGNSSGTYSYSNTATGNSGVVSGTILDEDGQGAVGANVVIKGTTIGVVTDLDGNFSLSVPQGNEVLEISYVGYIKQEIPIEHGRKVTVQLEPDAIGIEEVVVTALGIKKEERNLGYAVKTIGGGGYSSYSSGGGGSYTPKVKKSKPTSIPLNVQIENKITLEFTVETAYTIKSSGLAKSIDIKHLSLPAIYEYHCVPKVDPDAFLIAKIINWEKYNLLEGEVNLYFERTFIGKSILDVRYVADTLNISLGRDRSISVKREKVKEFTETKILGSNKVENKAWKIIVRNSKELPINLLLFDQIPVSNYGAITVDKIEHTNGDYNENTGEIKWNFTIKPKHTQEALLKYRVKYPKHNIVEVQ